MAYFLRTSIPLSSLLTQGLQQIHGIGKTTASQVCKTQGLQKDALTKDLRGFHKQKLGKELTEYPRPLAKDLQIQTQGSIQTLIDNRTYRGRRLKQGLPVRGQRTHTNARTARKGYGKKAKN